MSWIADLVALDRCDQPPGTETFTTSAAFGVGERLYGGLIAAQALAAAGATVAAERLPQSLHAYFIKGGRVGVDVEFTVELTRDGRSFNTRRVTALQDGAAIFEMLASFHLPEPTLDWQGPTASAHVPADDDTPSVPLPVEWADHFEIRTRTATAPDWPEQPFWFRSREVIEHDPLLQACALTFISDLGLVSAARPPGSTGPGPGGAASLDHAVWFHRPILLDRWHHYDAVGLTHFDARGLARGSISDDRGTLVASVAQESLWRP